MVRLNEGELKKQIQNEALRNLALKQILGFMVTEEDLQRKEYLPLSVIAPILDDVKKEFPKCADCEFFIKWDGKQRKHKGMTLMYQSPDCDLDMGTHEHECPKNVWKEKWLGEVT